MLSPAGDMRVLQGHRFSFLSIGLPVKEQLCKNFQEGHWGFTGRILTSHTGDLGLIPGRCTVLKFVLEKSMETHSSILA